MQWNNCKCFPITCIIIILQNYKIHKIYVCLRARYPHWNVNIGWQNCEVWTSWNRQYRAENLSNYILYFRNSNTLYFLFDRKGTQRLATINALVYQSFNVRSKVCFPSVQNFSPSFILFIFLLETTVKHKVPRYGNSGSPSRYSYRYSWRKIWQVGYLRTSVASTRRLRNNLVYWIKANIYIVQYSVWLVIFQFEIK